MRCFRIIARITPQQPFARIALLTIAIALAAAISLIVAFRIDISSARDYRSDVLVRDAFPWNESASGRFADPSPYAIFLPFEAHVWDSLRDGRLPLWERMQGGGYSPVVALQGGVFHPIRWIAALAPRDLMPSVLIVLSVAITLAGCVLFGLELGLSRAASVAGAFLFVLSPQLLSYLHYHGSLLPLMHLPWILSLYRRAERTPSRMRFAALAAVFGALWIAGHLLIALSVFLAALTLAIADSISLKRIRPMILIVAAALCGLFLAAFALMPPLVALPDMWTYKTTTDAGIAYRPMTLANWLTGLRNVVLDAQDGRSCCVDFPIYYAYIGICSVSLILALLHATTRSRPARLLLVTTVVWLLIVLPGPWMSILTALPPFRFMKPWYYAGAFACFAAFAAAYGFDHLRRTSRIAGWIGAALVLCAIATFVIRGYPIVAPQRWTSVIAGEPIERLRANSEPFRVVAPAGALHLPNTSRITGIEDVRLMAPFLPRRFREWWLLVDPDLARKSYPTLPATDVLDSPLVDDFNVAYVLQARFRSRTFDTATSGPRDLTLSPALVEPEFPLVMKTRSLEVRSNRGYGPRAHFANRVALAKDLDDALRILKRDPHLVRQTAIVEAASMPDVPPAASGHVSVRYPDDAHVVLETDSTTGGLVVLHDSYARGWTATVDENEATIYPVNVLSRGVIVGPGRHRIEMSYMPPGLIAGAALSGIVLIALVITARRSTTVDRNTH